MVHAIDEEMTVSDMVASLKNTRLVNGATVTDRYLVFTFTFTNGETLQLSLEDMVKSYQEN